MFQCLFFHAYLLTKKRKQMINNNGSNGQVNNINNSNNKASFIKDESKGEKVMSTISNKTKEMVLKVTKDLKTKLVSASTSNEVITHIISALTVNAVAGGGIDNIGEDDLQALYEVVTGANSEDTTFSRKVVTILNISKEAALCIGLYNNPSGLLTQRIIRNAAPQATAALIPAIIYTLLGDKAPAWAKKPFELDNEAYQRFLDLATDHDCLYVSYTDTKEEVIAKTALQEVNNLEIPKGISSVTCKNKYSKTEGILVSFDFNNKAIAYRHWDGKSQWLPLRDLVLLQYKVDKKAILEVPTDVRVIMALALKELNGKTAVEAEQYISRILKGSIIKESNDNVYGRYAISKNIFGEDVSMRTRPQIVEDNKVYPLGIECGSLKLSKGKISPNSYRELASNLDVPVASDKQSSKYWVIGAGAEALGLFLVDGKLVSYNPLDDANKGNNRIGAANFKYAQDPVVAMAENPTEQREESYTFSNLVTVLSTGERTATHGVARHTIIAPALGIAAQGMAITNNLTEEFVVVKTITQSVSLTTLGMTGFDAMNYDKVCKLGKEIKQQLISENSATTKVLKPNDKITWNGKTIYVHHKQTVVTIIFNEANISITPGQRGIGDAPTTMEFKFHGYSLMEKSNAKYRGAGVKATALALTTDDITVTEGGNEFSDWEILLSSEAYKTVEKVMELYANHHADNAIEILNGVLHKDGINAVEDFNEWLVSSLRTFTIEQKIHNSERATLEAAVKASQSLSMPTLANVNLGSHIVFVAIDDEYSWAIQEVKAIVGVGHYCIEVSTADENYGNMKSSQSMQYVQGTFPGMAEGFAKNVARKANYIPALIKDAKGQLSLRSVAKEFNLDNKEELDTLLGNFESASKAGNAKQNLCELINLVGKSFRVSFLHNNNVWVADVPLEAIVQFSRFDEEGNPSCDLSSNPDAEENSISKAQDVLDLISNIRKCFANKDHIVDKVKQYQAFTMQWVKDLSTNKVISNLTKANSTSYMKVVGDFTVGTFKYIYSTVTRNGKPQGVNADKTVELPIVYFHSNSPIWKEINENDLLIMTRVPYPTAVTIVARKSDKYDTTVAAVAPSVMYRATRGDFDGDSVQFTAIKKVSGQVPSYAQAQAFNDSVWSLGGYKQTINKDTDIVTDALRGVYKSKTAKKFSVTVYETTVKEWSRNQSLINEVYINHVPTTYGYATDALIKLFIGGFNKDEAKALEVIQAYISYEEDCLGGYNFDSYGKVKQHIVNVKAHVDQGNAGNLISKFSDTPARTINKFVRGGGVVKESATSKISFAMLCAIGYVQASRVAEGKMNAEAVAPIAISAYSIRNLSKKAQFQSEVNFYALDVKYGIKHNYSEIVEVLATTQIH
jgi:hypothetical protein